MSLFDWFKLNNRVGALEKTLFNLQKDNIALMSIPFLDPVYEKKKEEEFEGEGVVRGREIEEEVTSLDEDTVEETEYREEVKWLGQRKQKEKMV